MEDFKHTFLRLCRDNNIEPQDCVVSQLKRLESPRSKPVLDLSTNSLSAKTCNILGKVINTDRTFIEYKFADSMLSEDAIKGLAFGFSTNVHCRKLDLKGNNIRGTGAEALGKMLRHNHHLLSICLEWNALGMLDNSFAMFCEGVGANNSLQALDLRNNQISHDGAAELASSLKRNCTLRALDLRWNNVGLLGGRALLEMLQTNKTLCRLELAGNNIPGDILKSIEQDKTVQLSDLMDTIDKQEELLRKSKRSSAQQVGHLQETLEERKSAFNTLASKLAMTESELALTEQKANDFSLLITRLKQELSDKTSVHQDELRKEHEDRAIIEAKLYKEISEAFDKNAQLETKNEDLERRCKQQQDQIFELKEQITHLQAEVKLKGSHFDERIQQEKNRHKDDMRNAEQIRQKEVARTRHEADEAESALRERIQRLEMSRLELEEEVSRLKNINMTDKMHHDEQLSLAKQKIVAEEDNRHKQLEDKLRVLQATKDEVQSRCSQQSSTISELQSKNSSLVLEVETMKKRVEEMNQELAEKNTVTLSEVGKVKIELNQTVNKLEAERAMHAEVRDKLNDSDRKLSDSLKKKLKSRELELSNVREEEAQRAQVLQMAIMSYMNKAPPAVRKITNLNGPPSEKGPF
ncbi:hypothetical protein KUTeg_003678, partial [Tegillarca granosa]